MSLSEMCRRSSRRCAVMPSAPASIGEMRRPQRIGMSSAARVPDRRDVVDVDAEALQGRTGRLVHGSIGFRWDDGKAYQMAGGPRER